MQFKASPFRSLLRGSFLGLAALAFACGGSESDGNAPTPAGPDASTAQVDGVNTYISRLTVPALDGNTPTCCFDFGDRSKDGAGPDNAFARLADMVGAFVDFQAVLDDTLEDGDQVILLKHVGLSSPTGSFELEGLLGEFASSTSYEDAAAGDGTFTVKPTSYSGGKALISMSAEASNGDVTAGPSDFALSIPIGEVSIEVSLKETTLTGQASFEEGGVAYTGGTLSGYALVDDFFAGLNSYAASECACLGLGGELFSKANDSWSGNCVSGAEDKCPGSGCAALGGDNLFGGEACALLPDMIQGAADINLSGDTRVYEGFSVGLEWEGVPATITE